jgi:hypothetical protein
MQQKEMRPLIDADSQHQVPDVNLICKWILDCYSLTLKLDKLHPYMNSDSLLKPMVCLLPLSVLEIPPHILRNKPVHTY